MKFIVDQEKITGKLGLGELPISPDDTLGYRPFELFVSSLVGCSGTLLRNILQKKKFAIEKIEVNVSAVRNPDEANRIEKLSFIAEVHADKKLSTEQAGKVAELTVKNCGMIQSVMGTIDISFKVVFPGDSN
ncbi:OsmC family protein [Pseudomonas sp. ISL-84]|nr:OsmC family protein [Pseudomonas sp. ISL-84]